MGSVRLENVKKMTSVTAADMENAVVFINIKNSQGVFCQFANLLLYASICFLNLETTSSGRCPGSRDQKDEKSS